MGPRRRAARGDGWRGLHEYHYNRYNRYSRYNVATADGGCTSTWNASSLSATVQLIASNVVA